MNADTAPANHGNRRLSAFIGGYRTAGDGNLERRPESPGRLPQVLRPCRSVCEVAAAVPAKTRMVGGHQPAARLGDNQVIAVGGGAVLDKENVRNLVQGAFVVWLDGAPEVLRGRMEGEQRLGKIQPSLTGENPLTEIRQVLKTRRPVYEKVSVLRVDTSALGPAETTTVIIEALQEKRGKRIHGR